jgi:hypothetical protein
VGAEVIGRLRRWLAHVELDRIDAEVARWFIDDGHLSRKPLDRPLGLDAMQDPTRAALRVRRMEAVRRLEAVGGSDPWPSVLREPTEAQRAARSRR